MTRGSQCKRRLLAYAPVVVDEIYHQRRYCIGCRPDLCNSISGFFTYIKRLISERVDKHGESIRGSGANIAKGFNGCSAIRVISFKRDLDKFGYGPLYTGTDSAEGIGRAKAYILIIKGFDESINDFRFQIA